MTLLLTPQSRFRSFCSNFAEVVWFAGRREADLHLTTPTAEFWPDVFVSSGVAWRSLLDSLVYHAIVLVAIGGLSQLPWQQPSVRQKFSDHTQIIFFHVSEYLPPIQGKSERPRVRQRGDLARARQEVLSVPPESDNRNQTIITPPNVKLTSQIHMPNLVAWTPVPPSVPIPDSIRGMKSVALRNAWVSAALAPAPEVQRAAPTPQPKIAQSDIVAPPPAAALIPNTHFQQPLEAVIEPPPATMTRKLGGINLPFDVEPKIAAPKLSVPEQQASRSGATEFLGKTAGGAQAGQSAESAPDVRGLQVATPAGQLIALGLDPAAPDGAIEIPSGNRRGSFSAGPKGRLGASGTLELGGGGAGVGSGKEGDATGPEGIRIGSGPGSADADTAIVTGPPHLPSQGLIAAAMMPNNIRNFPRRWPREHVSDAPDLESQVFGPKKFYTMTLNMPNLNSTGGSWIIRFAELKENQQGELTAPIATEKVDPAYPAELMRTHIEGIVTLYAVIRSDGKIGDVRVLHGIDERLDAFARTALARCRFRPATKNGNAVALEAVFRIPFQANKRAF